MTSTHQTELTATVTSDDARRRELVVTIVEWRQTIQQKDDYAVCRLDNGEVLAAFINRDTTFMKPVVGRVGITVAVRTWRLNERRLLDRDTHWNADFRSVEHQPAEVQQLLGYVDSTAVAAPVAPPPPKPSKAPANAPKTRHGKNGRNVNSGACKPPSERKDQCKLTAMVATVGDAELIWKRWLEFQQATDNRIGHSSFLGLCVLEGLTAVLDRYK